MNRAERDSSPPDSLMLLTAAVSGALMLVSGALGFDIDYRFVTVVPGAS